MNNRVILFDLDGTLTDPVEGITKSIQHALNELGKPIPETKDLHWCIGPPLLDSFKRILGDNDSEHAMEALMVYRERFSAIGKFENRVYDSIPEVLSLLNKRGFSLFVATSKPRVFAIDIINHFKLDQYFNRVYGSELNGDLIDKTELIDHIITKEGIDRKKSIMVGDRGHDILGAKNNGLSSIGVTYGYGTREELLDSGADWLASSPSGIPDIIS